MGKIKMHGDVWDLILSMKYDEYLFEKVEAVFVVCHLIDQSVEAGLTFNELMVKESGFIKLIDEKNINYFHFYHDLDNNDTNDQAIKKLQKRMLEACMDHYDPSPDDPRNVAKDHSFEAHKIEERHFNQDSELKSLYDPWECDPSEWF